MKFYSIEPYGTPMYDLIQACNASLLANCNRDSKTTPEPYDYKQFMLFSTNENSQELEPAILENGMTVSEFKNYIYLKALAERSKKAE